MLPAPGSWPPRTAALPVLHAPGGYVGQGTQETGLTAWNLKGASQAPELALALPGQCRLHSRLTSCRGQSSPARELQGASARP